MTRTPTTRWLLVGLVLVLQAALLSVAVWPRVSARVAGEEILLRAQPVDPIDPFRGAYVALAYPGLDPGGSGQEGRVAPGDRGRVYLVLREDEEGFMVAESATRTRPDSGDYLACDDRSWRLRCGIEDWFLPQDEAAQAEADLADGAVATVRVDGRGNAALVGLE
jgi:uncharacterized membrane-anchored protein